jgi:glycosyltransferase involved in cell wall biosynthesis
MPHGVPIVVDDASADNTADVARRAGAIVVQNSTNYGYDVAINQGFRYAHQIGMEFVVTADGDGQHSAASIGAALAELENGADLVVGYRPKMGRISEFLFAAITRRRFGIIDPLCGLKGYRMALYRELGYFASHSSIGTELMLFGVSRGCRLAQIGVPIAKRNGRSRFGHVFSGNLKIMRAILAMYRA